MKSALIIVGLLLLVGGVLAVPRGVDDSYTTSLLHFDNTTNNGQVFRDESTVNVWTRNVAVTATNASKFGNSSGYFDGTVSYIQTPTNATAFNVEDEDFTIEAWINTTKPALTTAGVQKIWGGAGANDPYFTLYNNKLAWHDGTTLHTGNTELINKTWYHVVVTRSSGVSNMRVNGISQGVWTDYVLYNWTTPTIGQAGGGGYYRGSIDELRFSRYSRWTDVGDFTPPTLPYAPSLAAMVSANVTYIKYNDYVQFTDVSVGDNVTAWDWNFGDGTANSTSQNPIHKYAYGGEARVSLIVTNNTGSKAWGLFPAYVVSNAPKVYLDGASINYGIPVNLSLKQNGMFSADGTLVNVTFNASRLRVTNVFNSDSEPDALIVATIGNGFVLLNESVVDKTWSNTSAALIQLNVTSPTGLSSEPLTIATSSGIFPNKSYTPATLMTYNGRYTGSITPTNNVFTQTFNIFRTDTEESLNTVQVSSTWTGVTSGSDASTDGTFSITSTWGSVNITSTASAFYQNDLYGVEIVGGTANIHMTPFVSNAASKINQLYPNTVEFKVVDAFNGESIPDVAVSATMQNTTTFGTNWFTQFFGISSAATDVETTTQYGTTDDDGSVIFTMLATGRYIMTFTNATLGINTIKMVYPSSRSYLIIVSTNAHPAVASMSDDIAINITAGSSGGNILLNMTYNDTGSQTTNVNFFVKYPNQTTAYSKNYPSIGGSNQSVSVSYSVPNTRGDAYAWGCSATNSKFGTVNKSQGITLKGADGMLFNPFEYKDRW